VTHSGYLIILLFVIALAIALFFLYRKSHQQHLKCVELCHRIANELSQRQEHELVVERVFNIIIGHTEAQIGILVFRDIDENKKMKVLRVHGMPEQSLKSGDHLESTQYGYGFGKLNIDDTGKLYQIGLKEAVKLDTGIELVGKQNMIAIPITSNEHTHGLLQLISSKNKPFTESDVNGLSGVGIYLDAAIQNANIIKTIRRQRDAAQSLYAIGLTISSFQELDEILHHAVQETQRLLKADFIWYMELFDEKGETGVVRNVAGDFNEHVDTGSIFPLAGRIAAMLKLQHQKINEKYILITDLICHKGTGPSGYTSEAEKKQFCVTEMSNILRKLDVNSGVIVPVANEHHIHGLLCSFSCQTDFFDNFHVSLQQRIANQLLIALSTAEYLSKSKGLAQAEERQRMSDELHDNMAQVISGLSLELHSFTKLLKAGQDKESLLKRLESIRPQLDRAKATIREGIFELRIPEGTDLWQNLADFAKRFERWHDFIIHVDLPETVLKLDIRQQHEILRTVQEALWNIRKHSGTHEAWLDASINKNNTFQILVKDKGKGFSNIKELDVGQGITTMRDRMERLQGKLNIVLNKPNGTIISLEVPLNVS